MEMKEKIKALRQEYGLSLQKFAKILDVSDTAVLKWEQGKTEPKASNLKTLAIEFDIDLEDFLDIDKSKRKNIHITNSFNNNSNTKINIKN